MVCLNSLSHCWARCDQSHCSAYARPCRRSAALASSSDANLHNNTVIVSVPGSIAIPQPPIVSVNPATG